VRLFGVARSAIEMLGDEVRAQPSKLEKDARRMLPAAPPGAIFVGAGDSYAAALAAQYASDGALRAVDPYVLSTQPQMAKNQEVFFISVSGRTSSNLEAAQKVRGIARKTTAITAVPGSPLGKLVKRTIPLPMKYAPKTPGMLSFCLSLLVVLKLARGNLTCDFPGAFAKAELDSRRVAFAKGTTYLLGNALAYPAAVYGAAKTYELLGKKSHAELLEEFSHMQLFSLEKSDAVNVFGAFDPESLGKKLTKALKEEGYSASLIHGWGSNYEERLFHAVFTIQLSVLRESRRRGLTGPNFLVSRERLRTSDEMIY
jgi:fructoselysine-6-P-deglycase FrlB-like protein